MIIMDKIQMHYNYLEKRSKTQEIKETLFNWTKQHKMREFWRKSSFSKLRATQK